MFNFSLNITKTKIKSISITHPCDFYCRMKITNNPSCIVLNVIWSEIIGSFSKWFLIARNRLNKTTVISEMRSTIKIENIPRSGLGKSLTPTGYISVLP